jgi:hypothetical protein
MIIIMAPPTVLTYKTCVLFIFELHVQDIQTVLKK